MDSDAIKTYQDLTAQVAKAEEEILREIRPYVNRRLKIDPRWGNHDGGSFWVYPPRVTSFKVTDEESTVKLEAPACGCGCSDSDRAYQKFPPTTLG